MNVVKVGVTWTLATLLAGAGLAQQAAFDKAAILKELDRLEQAHREKSAAEQKSTAESLVKALSNTKVLLDLYEEAVFATKFEGWKKETAEFKKWKNAQDDTLKSDDFQAALAIHANYLYLTFLRATGENEAKLVEALLQHVAKVWAAEAKREIHTRATADLLERPVTQGVLARHLQLGPKLGGPQEGEKPKEQDKTWEWLAANTDGMLDKTVFPFLRKNKSPLLLTVWDKRITTATARAKQAGMNLKSAQFTQQTLPKLNWRRACDQVLLGKETEGFSTMIGILRQNPGLPEFDKHVQELRSLLGGGETAPTAPTQN